MGIPGEDGPAQASDPVCVSAADGLIQAYGSVADVAIGVDLRSARVLSILGPKGARLDLARALCCQLAVLHAPEELRLLLCAPSTDAPDWEWIKWLPHLRGGQDGARGESSPERVDDPAVLDALVSPRVARARPAQPGAGSRGSGAAPFARASLRSPTTSS